MEDIHSILINVISNIAWLPIGIVLTAVSIWIKVRVPNRRLWRVDDPARLTVCVATSTTTNTGLYNRPSTGIGQVRALALATRSLNKAYSNKLDVSNIILSVEPLQDRFDNDLLILGGPKNNKIAAKFLSLISEEQPAAQIDSMIVWRVHKSGGHWIDQGALEYEGQAVNRRVEVDYGLIVRAQSPFTSHPRTAILFAGSHTYGTVAASKFFTEDLHQHLRKLTRDGRKNFSVLISTQVVDGHPTKMKVERSYAW
ncbi:hypothetical protein [Dictyobacter aurantiacus]|uniref:S-layer protein C-terminal domain-containing protein n=1 Tax=Dictyobacter aurantiacus TaxID=1936993 RepID=A0A401ZCZ2_9CHLR|nr:hypothetical protein [Dictyobacter aurantiacus]GCE04712.1 hypothetical protein KDAU_20410 [Dictyobacter aurantiacus]